MLYPLLEKILKGEEILEDWEEGSRYRRKET